MKNLIISFTFAAVTYLLLGGPAFGEIKVTLKNGNEIIADECRSDGDILICYKIGGSFEIEKVDIASTANITIKERYMAVEEETEKTAPEKAEPPKKDAEGGAVSDSKASGASEKSQGRTPVDNEAAAGLLAEREKLVLEQKKVQEDVKNAPIYMNQVQFNELKRRNDEIEEKIKAFNVRAKQFSGEDKGASETQQK